MWITHWFTNYTSVCYGHIGDVVDTLKVNRPPRCGSIYVVLRGGTSMNANQLSYQVTINSSTTKYKMGQCMEVCLCLWLTSEASVTRVPHFQDWGMDANQSARGTNPIDESANLLVTIFSPKLHENESNWSEKIVGASRHSLDSPMHWTVSKNVSNGQNR